MESDLEQKMRNKETEKRIPAPAREALCWVAAMADTLDWMENEFVPLASRVENGVERYNQIREMMNGLLVDLLDTVPVQQLISIRAQLKSLRIRLVPKNAPIDQEKYVWTMDIDDIAKLASAAVDIRCTMCDKTAGNPCELRRILKDLPVEIQDKEIYINCMK